MKIDIKHLSKFIQEAKGEEVGQKEDYKQLMGIISGNKSYVKKATMNDILYLLGNLDDIITMASGESYPQINLREAPLNKVSIRRAL